MVLLDSLLTTSKRAAKWALRETWYRNETIHPVREEKPFLVRLDINDTCNMLCRKCFYPDYCAKNPTPTYMSVEDFRTVASRLFPYAYCVQLACGFESLLHPRYVEILEIADGYDIPYMGMVTNGSLLKGEKADAIIRSRNMKVISVSLDAVDPRVFETVRGKPLVEAVLRNVEVFEEKKRQAGRTSPAININTRIMKSNLRDLPALVAWCGQRRIENVQLFHVMPFDRSNEESVLGIQDEYNAVREVLLGLSEKHALKLRVPPPLSPEYYDAKSGRYSLLPRESEKGAPASEYAVNPYPAGSFCLCPWMVVAVNARGDVAPCGPRSEHCYANIVRQELFDALNSIRILRLRRAVRKGRRLGACEGCEPIIPYADPLTERLPGIAF